MDEDTKKTAERRATLEAVLANMDPLKREKLIEDHYATRAYLETWRKERGKI